jgi:pimeloyl-ACP methyl ester carboxylesterase
MGWLLRLFGVLLMLSALALSLARAPDRAVETLVARWALAPSDFIEVKGQLVHLRDEGPRGDPEPIVLIHGTAGSLHTWDGWVRALKGTRRVIRFDLPGCGLTGPFSGQYTPDDYRGDSYAHFLLDLLDALKVSHAVLAGNSMGGEVAWRTAFLAPQRVSRLILLDASGTAVGSLSVPLGLRLAGIPLLNPLAESALPRALVAQSLAALYGDPSRVTNEQVDRYFELALRQGNRRALGLQLQGQILGADQDRIATLKVPTLILWGGRDRLIPTEAARRFERGIAGSQLVIFDDLGHLPQEEDPVRTVAAARGFLQMP